MKVEDEEEEEEDEEEKEEEVVKEGEEEEKEEEEDKGEEEKKEEEVGEIRGKAGDDGWEGEEEVDVDTPVRYRRKADINRRAPEPRDKYRCIPCRKCERLGRECQEQMQGSAC